MTVATNIGVLKFSTIPTKNIHLIRAFRPEPGMSIKQVEKASRELNHLGVDLFRFFAQNVHLIPANNLNGETFFFLEGAHERNGKRVAPCMRKVVDAPVGWLFSHREIIPSVWDERHAALYLESQPKDN